MVKQFEYKYVSFQFQQESKFTKLINKLEINGVPATAWQRDAPDATTLSDLLTHAGDEGWELVSHCVDEYAYHHLYFKREKYKNPMLFIQEYEKY